MNSQINVIGKRAAFFCIIHRKQIYSITNSIWPSRHTKCVPFAFSRAKFKPI